MNSDNRMLLTDDDGILRDTAYADFHDELEATGEMSMLVDEQALKVDEATGLPIYRFKLFSETPGVNRNGWLLRVDGVQTDNYMGNPVIYFNHDWQRSRDTVYPVANMVGFVKKGKSLYGDMVFHGLTEKSVEVERLVKARVLRAGSVSYIPLEEEMLEPDDPDNWFYDWYIGPMEIKKADLLEFSIVNIPADPTALRQAKMQNSDPISAIKSMLKEIEGIRV